MNSFCTIITADYYPRALALFQSLAKFDRNLSLHVLVADNKPVSEAQKHAGLKLVQVNSLAAYPMVESLYRKYAHDDIDAFRWSLKPVFISYLLENGFDKIVYVDTDMFFVNDYHFLFKELETASVLLTPHWKNADPLVDRDSFLSLLTSGIYTAGFIGVSRTGLPAMKWWAAACHFAMGIQFQLGIHDDQKYLDLLPVQFEAVKIMSHRGCTVGSWNSLECERKLVNGQVLINGKYPVIFIHFDEMLVAEILKGHDPLLLPYLKAYEQTFSDNGYHLSDFIKAVQLDTNANLLIRMKWKLKLRTRIKKMLSRMASSI